MWPAACSFFLLDRDKLFFIYSWDFKSRLSGPHDARNRRECVRHHDMRNVGGVYNQ